MTLRWFVTSSRDSPAREARAERQSFEEVFALLFGPERFQEDWKLSEPEQRAITLLKNNLSPVQRTHFDRYRHFEAIGGVSSKRYRIRYGRSMNRRTAQGWTYRLSMVLFTAWRSSRW